jgi:hypothetical protein
LKTKLHSSGRRNRERFTSHHSKAGTTLPGKTIQELALEQGAKPFDPQAFAGIVPPGEDMGAFVEAIYRARTKTL